MFYDNYFRIVQDINMSQITGFYLFQEDNYAWNE